MCVTEAPPDRPDWNLLYATAACQEGLFTTQQAAEAGCSPQLLVHHLAGGRVVRVLRGIYRLVNYPMGEHEELVAAWLWSGRVALISHQTALALHGLSDVLPAKAHLPLPSASRRGPSPRGCAAGGSLLVRCGPNDQRTAHAERLRTRGTVARAAAPRCAAGASPRSCH